MRMLFLVTDLANPWEEELNQEGHGEINVKKRRPPKYSLIGKGNKETDLA